MFRLKSVLSVRYRNGQCVILRGHRELEDGCVCFTNDYPLIGINLCAGEYEYEKIHTDGKDFEVYFLIEKAFFQT